jgi:predicted Zn-dependent protease
VARSDPLPDLGEPSQTILSPVVEQKIGNQFMQQLRATGKVIDDPIDAQYINGLGKQLLAGAHVNSQRFFFFFMDDPVVNSFAGPGGYIAINSGLLLATQSESELAAVMAHEIAHVTQGHLARKLANASHLKYSILAGMLAAIALGRVNGDAAEGAIAATMAGSVQAQLNYSRAYEEEADRVGITTLANAGFDPYSMPRFFQRLQNQERYNVQPLTLLSDHPLTPDRIADAENRAAQYPTPHKPQVSDYALIKERIRVQTAPDEHSILLYYQKLRQAPHYQNQPAIEYGNALAEQNAALYDQAYQDLSVLAGQDPNQLLFQLAMADVLVDANKPVTALPILQRAYDIYPDSYPVMVQYAYTLLKAGQPQQALTVLNHYQLNYPDMPVPYNLLADVQAKAGQLAQAYQTRAIYLVQMGATGAAIGQLSIALALPNNSADTVARIKAQMQQIRQEAMQ